MLSKRVASCKLQVRGAKGSKKVASYRFERAEGIENKLSIRFVIRNRIIGYSETINSSGGKHES
jgi:hypothetical protein